MSVTRLHRRARWLLVGSLGLSATIACARDGGVILDDWGPPAGYAILTGTVRRSTGAPLPTVAVTFARCESPVGGFLAADTTDVAGRFQVVAHLPPRGFIPASVVDTLRLRCGEALQWSGVTQDSVWVRFAPTVAAAPTTRVDLVIP
jgi:hypothetical protein